MDKITIQGQNYCFIDMDEDYPFGGIQETPEHE